MDVRCILLGALQMAGFLFFFLFVLDSRESPCLQQRGKGLEDGVEGGH